MSHNVIMNMQWVYDGGIV